MAKTYTSRRTPLILTDLAYATSLALAREAQAWKVGMETAAIVRPRLKEHNELALAAATVQMHQHAEQMIEDLLSKRAAH